MADLTLVPVYPQTLEDVPPPTIVSTLGDGSTLRRRKGTAFRRRFRNRYVCTAAQADTLRDLWRTKGTDTTLTIVTYDEREAAATEATVYFVGPIQRFRTGPNRYEIEVEFEEA